MNTNFRRGLAYEAAEQDPAWTPAVTDAFYSLGIPNYPRQVSPNTFRQVVQTYAGDVLYPTPWSGCKVCKGTFAFKPVNLLDAYLTLGHSATASGVRTITPLTSGDLQSLRMYERIYGGTQEIIRNVLGLKVVSASWTWDKYTGAELECALSVLGSLERDATHATKPAVALTTDPSDATFPTGSNNASYSLLGAGSFSHWDQAGTPVDIDPTLIQIYWNNNLNNPDYVQGGSTANGSSSFWPIGINKKMPGAGSLAFNYLCNGRWAHNAIIESLDKQVSFKFYSGAYYRIFNLYNVMLEETPFIDNLQGVQQGWGRVTASFGKLEVVGTDGTMVAATWYGE